MKTTLRIVGLVMMALILSASAMGQFKERGWGGGVMYGWDFGMTGLNDDQGRFHARAFVRHGIIDHVQIEASAGVGSIAGSGTRPISKYTTELIPLDLRLVLNPFTWESAVPYVFGGGGFVHKRIVDLPIEAPTNAKLEEWVGYVPVGAGMMVNLQEHVYLDLSLGYNYTLTKKLTGYPSSNEDAFITGLFGISVSFE